MSTSAEITKESESSLTKAAISLVRYYRGGRRGLILLSVAALGSAMALNWGWLVAVGIAPLLLVLAPCAAMCALGLCMNKMDGKSCSTESSSGAQDAKANRSSPPSTANARDEA